MEQDGLYYDYDGNPITADEWVMLWQKDRVIQQDDYDRGRISTVWIGLDQGFGLEGAPLIFETMIFGGKFNGEQWRAATRKEALRNHMAAYQLMRDARGKA